MFGGISDEQIDGFIDTAASMDPVTLRYINMYLYKWF
jgi:hypothetical protein